MKKKRPWGKTLNAEDRWFATGGGEKELQRKRKPKGITTKKINGGGKGLPGQGRGRQNPPDRLFSNKSKREKKPGSKRRRTQQKDPMPFREEVASEKTH